MYPILRELLGYTGTTNIDSQLVYASICLIMLFIVLFLDVLYRFFMRFIPRG